MQKAWNSLSYSFKVCNETIPIFKGRAQWETLNFFLSCCLFSLMMENKRQLAVLCLKDQISLFLTSLQTTDTRIGRTVASRSESFSIASNAMSNLTIFNSFVAHVWRHRLIGEHEIFCFFFLLSKPVSSNYWENSYSTNYRLNYVPCTFIFQSPSSQWLYLKIGLFGNNHCQIILQWHGTHLQNWLLSKKRKRESYSFLWPLALTLILAH